MKLVRIRRRTICFAPSLSGSYLIAVKNEFAASSLQSCVDSGLSREVQVWLGLETSACRGKKIKEVNDRHYPLKNYRL